MGGGDAQGRGTRMQGVHEITSGGLGVVHVGSDLAQRTSSFGDDGTVVIAQTGGHGSYQVRSDGEEAGFGGQVLVQLEQRGEANGGRGTLELGQQIVRRTGSPWLVER